MKISVKQEHIERGKRWRQTLCPIALAIEEVMGKKVFVNENYFTIVGKNKEEFDLPLSCFRFVDDFDQGLPVKPFSFRIKEPRE